jgi:hypothetical protein
MQPAFEVARDYCREHLTLADVDTHMWENFTGDGLIDDDTVEDEPEVLEEIRERLVGALDELEQSAVHYARDTTELIVEGNILTLSGGMSGGDSPSETYDTINLLWCAPVLLEIAGFRSGDSSLVDTSARSVAASAGEAAGTRLFVDQQSLQPGDQITKCGLLRGERSESLFAHLRGARVIVPATSDKRALVVSSNGELQELPPTPGYQFEVLREQQMSPSAALMLAAAARVAESQAWIEMAAEVAGMTPAQQVEISLAGAAIAATSGRLEGLADDASS